MPKSNPRAASALKRAEAALHKAQARVVRLRRAAIAVEVQDYAFRDQAGRPVRLSRLFGKKSELILVHNMGMQCRHCTLWADGFTGLVPHLEDRAAFAVESGDPPAQQGAFYRSRGWNFRMVSSVGSPFKRDLGFADADGDPLPGVTVFVKKKGKLYRTAQERFGPGDGYCALWHFLDLLPGGARGWEPQYSYR
jgi:predicted dithiol-disulfide oxidoreductase (DUF899 family)